MGYGNGICVRMGYGYVFGESTVRVKYCSGDVLFGFIRWLGGRGFGGWLFLAAVVVLGWGGDGFGFGVAFGFGFGFGLGMGLGLGLDLDLVLFLAAIIVMSCRAGMG